ncbi:spatacsin [Anaeramoeba ignava]|uniref:Spatacsin n=1 Tax=Anaeramoeba ignava TaxID=1746090 RepID=A0A9Q0RGJ4_ANAIG|nr:spatacsin [Anaeramoeba ignava]
MISNSLTFSIQNFNSNCGIENFENAKLNFPFLAFLSNDNKKLLIAKFKNLKSQPYLQKISNLEIENIKNFYWQTIEQTKTKYLFICDTSNVIYIYYFINKKMFDELENSSFEKKNFLQKGILVDFRNEMANIVKITFEDENQMENEDYNFVFKCKITPKFINEILYTKFVSIKEIQTIQILNLIQSSTSTLQSTLIIDQKYSLVCSFHKHKVICLNTFSLSLPKHVQEMYFYSTSKFLFGDIIPRKTSRIFIWNISNGSRIGPITSTITTKVARKNKIFVTPDNLVVVLFAANFPSIEIIELDKYFRNHSTKTKLKQEKFFSFKKKFVEFTESVITSFQLNFKTKEDKKEDKKEEKEKEEKESKTKHKRSKSHSQLIKKDDQEPDSMHEWKIGHFVISKKQLGLCLPIKRSQIPFIWHWDKMIHFSSFSQPYSPYWLSTPKNFLHSKYNGFNFQSSTFQMKIQKEESKTKAKNSPSRSKKRDGKLTHHHHKSKHHKKRKSQQQQQQKLIISDKIFSFDDTVSSCFFYIHDSNAKTWKLYRKSDENQINQEDHFDIKMDEDPAIFFADPHIVFHFRKIKNFESQGVLYFFNCKKHSENSRMLNYLPIDSNIFSFQSCCGKIKSLFYIPQKTFSFQFTLLNWEKQNFINYLLHLKTPEFVEKLHSLNNWEYPHSFFSDISKIAIETQSYDLIKYSFSKMNQHDSHSVFKYLVNSSESKLKYFLPHFTRDLTSFCLFFVSKFLLQISSKIQENTEIESEAIEKFLNELQYLIPQTDSIFLKTIQDSFIISDHENQNQNQNIMMMLHLHNLIQKIRSIYKMGYNQFHQLAKQYSERLKMNESKKQNTKKIHIQKKIIPQLHSIFFGRDNNKINEKTCLEQILSSLSHNEISRSCSLLISTKLYKNLKKIDSQLINNIQENKNYMDTLKSITLNLVYSMLQKNAKIKKIYQLLRGMNLDPLYILKNIAQSTLDRKIHNTLLDHMIQKDVFTKSQIEDALFLEMCEKVFPASDYLSQLNSHEKIRNIMFQDDLQIIRSLEEKSFVWIRTIKISQDDNWNPQTLFDNYSSHLQNKNISDDGIKFQNLFPALKSFKKLIDPQPKNSPHQKSSLNQSGYFTAKLNWIQNWDHETRQRIMIEKNNSLKNLPQKEYSWFSQLKYFVCHFNPLRLSLPDLSSLTNKLKSSKFSQILSLCSPAIKKFILSHSTISDPIHFTLQNESQILQNLSSNSKLFSSQNTLNEIPKEFFNWLIFQFIENNLVNLIIFISYHFPKIINFQNEKISNFPLIKFLALSSENEITNLINDQEKIINNLCQINKTEPENEQDMQEIHLFKILGEFCLSKKFLSHSEYFQQEYSSNFWKALSNFFPKFSLILKQTFSQLDHKTSHSKIQLKYTDQGYSKIELNDRIFFSLKQAKPILAFKFWLLMVFEKQISTSKDIQENTENILDQEKRSISFPILEFSLKNFLISSIISSCASFLTLLEVNPERFNLIIWSARLMFAYFLNENSIQSWNFDRTIKENIELLNRKGNQNVEKVVQKIQNQIYAKIEKITKENPDQNDKMETYKVLNLTINFLKKEKNNFQSKFWNQQSPDLIIRFRNEFRIEEKQENLSPLEKIFDLNLNWAQLLYWIDNLEIPDLQIPSKILETSSNIHQSHFKMCLKNSIQEQPPKIIEKEKIEKKTNIFETSNEISEQIKKKNQIQILDNPYFLEKLMNNQNSFIILLISSLLKKEDNNSYDDDIFLYVFNSKNEKLAQKDWVDIIKLIVKNKEHFASFLFHLTENHQLFVVIKSMQIFYPENLHLINFLHFVHHFSNGHYSLSEKYLRKVSLQNEDNIEEKIHWEKIFQQKCIEKFLGSNNFQTKIFLDLVTKCSENEKYHFLKRILDIFQEIHNEIPQLNILNNHEINLVLMINQNKFSHAKRFCKECKIPYFRGKLQKIVVGAMQEHVNEKWHSFKHIIANNDVYSKEILQRNLSFRLFELIKYSIHFVQKKENLIERIIWRRRNLKANRDIAQALILQNHQKIPEMLLIWLPQYTQEFIQLTQLENDKSEQNIIQKETRKVNEEEKKILDQVFDHLLNHELVDKAQKIAEEYQYRPHQILQMKICKQIASNEQITISQIREFFTQETQNIQISNLTTIEQRIDVLKELSLKNETIKKTFGKYIFDYKISQLIFKEISFVEDNPQEALKHLFGYGHEALQTIRQFIAFHKKELKEKLPEITATLLYETLSWKIEKKTKHSAVNATKFSISKFMSIENIVISSDQTFEKSPSFNEKKEVESLDIFQGILSVLENKKGFEKIVNLSQDPISIGNLLFDFAKDKKKPTTNKDELDIELIIASYKCFQISFDPRGFDKIYNFVHERAPQYFQAGKLNLLSRLIIHIRDQKQVEFMLEFLFQQNRLDAILVEISDTEEYDHIKNSLFHFLKKNCPSDEEKLVLYYCSFDMWNELGNFLMENALSKINEIASQLSIKDHKTNFQIIKKNFRELNQSGQYLYNAIHEFEKSKQFQKIITCFSFLIFIVVQSQYPNLNILGMIRIKNVKREMLYPVLLSVPNFFHALEIVETLNFNQFEIWSEILFSQVLLKQNWGYLFNFFQIFHHDKELYDQVVTFYNSYPKSSGLEERMKIFLTNMDDQQFQYELACANHFDDLVHQLERVASFHLLKQEK